jgi:alpha-methylacyl-CoA racemase
LCIRATHPLRRERATSHTHPGHTPPAPAPRFSRTPGELGRPPGRTGQHSREALTEWGVTDVDGLIAAGVVIQEEQP